MRLQRGFTLLELMVAMVIFALLAVAGWQVFDSVNQVRERAQFHDDNVAKLQYAYLQLQQDMAQTIAYQAPTTQGPTGNNSTENGNQAQEVAPEPFMRLDSQQVSFVRFADPDPRYQSSSSVQHVEYVFVDESLIRRQYTSMGQGNDSVSLDSVLLDGVTAGRWHAYLPDLSDEFPATNNMKNGSSTSRSAGQSANANNNRSDVALLPKGVAVSFTYQEIPITWQWALAPQSIPASGQYSADDSNSNGDSNNGDTGNGNQTGRR